jgi:hypothetical protein
MRWPDGNTVSSAILMVAVIVLAGAEAFGMIYEP